MTRPAKFNFPKCSKAKEIESASFALDIPTPGPSEWSGFNCFDPLKDRRSSQTIAVLMGCCSSLTDSTDNDPTFTKLHSMQTHFKAVKLMTSALQLELIDSNGEPAEPIQLKSI